MSLIKQPMNDGKLGHKDAGVFLLQGNAGKMEWLLINWETVKNH